MDDKAIAHIFDNHPPTTDEEQLAHELVREAYKQMAKVLSRLTDSRERSLALTKLEESSFFAHAAIARNP